MNSSMKMYKLQMASLKKNSLAKLNLVHQCEKGILLNLPQFF